MAARNATRHPMQRYLLMVGVHKGAQVREKRVVTKVGFVSLLIGYASESLVFLCLSCSLYIVLLAQSSTRHELASVLVML